MYEKFGPEITTTEQSTDGKFWKSALEQAVSAALEEGVEDPDAGALAASAMSEIDKLMVDLVSARDYLSTEVERIKRDTARLKNLSKTAVASVQIISDNLSKWRMNEKQAA